MNQDSTDDVTNAACVMAATSDVRAIVSPTASGRTARMLSRYRPRSWIIAQPHNEFVGRKLMLVWGVKIGDTIPVPRSVEELMRKSYDSLKRTEVFFEEDAKVIFTCGTPMGKVGSTNLVQKWAASVSPVPEEPVVDTD